MAGLLLLLAGACAPASRVVVAAGTTLVDSGLLEEVVRVYEDLHPEVEFSVVGDATAQVLELGRRGAATVLITHDPEAEAAFVAEGRAARYELIFESRFVLLGPPDLVGRLDTTDLAEILAEVAQRGWPFVSRGDRSGTHAREQDLWRRAGIDPTGHPWYASTGQGMGLTLQVADQRRAFTLAELGAWRSSEAELGLVDTGASGAELDNPYHLTVVAGADGEAPAVAFLEWLLSPPGREAVEEADRRLFGEVVYRPGR